MAKEKKAYTLQERREQIIKQFNVWHENGDDDPKTMYRIAAALNMTPQQHVTNILLGMVADGLMTFEERDKKGRWTARYYSLIKSLITEKSLRREIPVRKRGVAVGQLGLFS